MTVCKLVRQLSACQSNSWQQALRQLTAHPSEPGSSGGAVNMSCLCNLNQPHTRQLKLHHRTASVKMLGGVLTSRNFTERAPIKAFLCEISQSSVDTVDSCQSWILSHTIQSEGERDAQYQSYELKLCNEVNEMNDTICPGGDCGLPS